MYQEITDSNDSGMDLSIQTECTVGDVYQVPGRAVVLLSIIDQHNLGGVLGPAKRPVLKQDV